MDIPGAKQIIESGLLGAILIAVSTISVIVARTLFSLLISEKEKRLEDAKKLNDGLFEPINQLKKNGDQQLTLLQQILGKLTKV